ncbi:hypothetical protein N7457_009853 [Penicillium paradoxum]|uniref:uncharacterized protein n=1 Tax=Penicillium paradoxum TaxID=176176 RepID=UPI002547FCD6|nr:uncharacterized protein N7457_009853 [Penicillium paradoxum]KAJ5774957.1 hypothetical protein N7457_009853 [Penicillium paradoxum]
MQYHEINKADSVDCSPIAATVRIQEGNVVSSLVGTSHPIKAQWNTHAVVIGPQYAKVSL